MNELCLFMKAALYFLLECVLLLLKLECFYSFLQYFALALERVRYASAKWIQKSTVMSKQRDLLQINYRRSL